MGLYFELPVGPKPLLAAPAAPTLTAPATGAIIATEDAGWAFAGETVTYTATTSDTDVTMTWIAYQTDPDVDGVVVATKAPNGAYTTTAAMELDEGDYSLIARATRGAQTADSDPISFTATLLTLQTPELLADGTYDLPAHFWHLDGTKFDLDVEVWAPGAGGQQDDTGGGGGMYAKKRLTRAGGATLTVAGLAGAAADTDATDATVDTSACVARGGLSGTNGGTAATSGGVGDTIYLGGDGGTGGGTQLGGGGGGDSANASTFEGGATNGGYGTSVATGGHEPGGGGGCTAGAQRAGGRGAFRATFRVPVAAGYPRIVARTWGRDTTNLTSRDIVIPAGAGGLLSLKVASDGAVTLAGTGWTLADSDASGTAVTCGLLYRTADGSDPVAITTASQQVTWQCDRIMNAGTPAVSKTNSSGTNADPPDRNPGSSAKRLWEYAIAWDDVVAVSAVPSGYSPFGVAPGSAGGSARLRTGYKLAEAASDNPGPTTSTTQAWAALTTSYDYAA